MWHVCPPREVYAISVARFQRRPSQTTVLSHQRSAPPGSGLRPVKLIALHCQRTEVFTHLVPGTLITEVVDAAVEAREPGIGKSRLLYEFAQALRDMGVGYLEGYCFAYDQATPYGPVRGMLRQLCGMTDADGPEAMTTKLRQYLRSA
jgi:hypothetical protein